MRTILPVTEVRRETPSTVTLRFDYPVPASPGQFVMIWVPGDDEIPMSLSYVGERKGVTIKTMGATSRRIQSVRPGTLLGFRGPYGNRFDVDAGRILVVGGGSGSAVLAPAAEAARARGASVTAALGATTREELLFEDRFRAIGAGVEVATDDGSKGRPGYVTLLAAELLAREPFDVVWTCGPEVMMRKVAEAAAGRDVPVVFSVERHMKCGIGLCDACSLGPFHVCVDGPVFSAGPILAVPDFGRYKRDASGRRVPH